MKSREVIKELNLGKSSNYYEMAPGDHHHHLVCNECGIISHTRLKEEKLLLISKDFKVTSHSLEFYGLCQKCQ